jgi:alpha-amylase
MTAKNDTMLQCFEWYLKDDGTFWKQVKEEAPSFSTMGITCAWLPPAYKGQGGIHDVGYGVYDMYDLGEFDQKGAVRTKYGTKKEYLSAVKALQDEQIAVIADIVFNHRMGADGKETVMAVEDDPSNREHDETGPEQIETWTRFTFPKRKGRYSSFTWDHTCFDGTDWDDDGHRNAIYRFQGKQWDDEVDDEEGNYDYLMGCDLDMGNPKVIQELHDWGKWYLDTVPLDGVRLDALKHIRFTFFESWLEDMDRHCGRQLFAVGEYWNADVNKLLHYLDVNNNCLSLFDVSLHYNFYNAANSSGSYDMGSLLNNTLMNARPMNTVTFVDNHDTQPGQALSSFVMGWFKPLAYAVILLRAEGLPCVFYGDLFGIPHDHIAPVKELKPLIKLRELAAYGSENDYFDDQDIVGWTRSGDPSFADSGMAVLISDGPGGSKTMQVGQQFASQVFVDALGNQKDRVTIDQDGNGDFSVNGGSVSVWVTEKMAAAVKQAVK